jgi:hypothetical protein
MGEGHTNGVGAGKVAVRRLGGRRLKIIGARLSGNFVSKTGGLRHISSRFQICIMKTKSSPPILDRAWTHSLPARSACALLRCKILLTRSQLARIKGEL